MFSIEVLLTENELAEEFLAALEQRYLPEKFFYWFPLSVRAWLALCSDGEYRNYVRSRSLIARTADELSKLLPQRPLEVLSLGSGQGDKDLILLEALRARGSSVSYHPLDISLSLLEMAVGGARRAGLQTTGIKADFTNSAHLSDLQLEEGPSRLVMLIGNTLGAFDPMSEAAQVASLLREGDFLLVDGELYGGEETLAGYDNPLNRRFAWAPLLSVGIGEDDGRLTFELSADGRMPGLYLISKHFEAKRRFLILLGGETIEIDAGERLLMNHSYKFAPDSLRKILNGAGLEVRWESSSDDGRFLMALTTRAP